MTPELKERIAKATHLLHQQGVQPNLIILGRSEEVLLEGDNPDTVTFESCKYMIDDKSKSRCDVYGQFSTNHVRATTYKKQIALDEQQLRAQSARNLLQEAAEEFLNRPPTPTISAQAILRTGLFADKSYKDRRKNRIECYELKVPIGK